MLIKKNHPEEINNSIRKSKNIVFLDNDALQSNNLILEDILNASDFVVTDYSSLGIECLLLNKKIIYINWDIKAYVKNRGIYFDDINFWQEGGVSVNNIDEFITELKNDFEVCHNYNSFILSNNYKASCENICDYFFENGKLKKCVKKRNNILKEKINHIVYLDKEIEFLRNVIKQNDECIKSQQEDIDFLHNVIKQNDECIKSQQEDIDFLHNVIKQNDECMKSQQEDIDFLHDVIKQNDECINGLNVELLNIKNSKLWKILKKIRSLKRIK